MKHCCNSGLLFILLTAYSSYGQLNTDSLLQATRDSRNSIPDKIDAYKHLTSYYSLKDFDKTITLADKGIQLARQAGDSSALGTIMRDRGSAYYFKGKYDSAAVMYYASVKALENAGNPRQMAYTFNELAKLYRKTRDLDKSITYYDQALFLFKQIPDSLGIQMILNESGVVYEYRKEYDEAIRRYQQSLAIARERKDPVGIGYSLSFIAGVYIAQKKFTEAENFLQRALEIRESLRDTFTIALTRSDLGALYAAKGDYDKAKENFDMSNLAAGQLKYPELQSSNFQQLSGLASEKGDYRGALEYYKKYSSIRDSLFSIEKTKQINELNARYESERKEQEILLQRSELKRKNFAIAGVSSLLLLAGLLGWSGYRRYRLKQKAALQLAVLRQQELATRAILEAEEKERQRIARDLHDGVGQIMSAAKMNLSSFENEINFLNEDQKQRFEKILKLVDESCHEVRQVSHNMMPNVLLKKGLPAAIREFIDKIHTRQLEIGFHSEGMEQRLNQDTETILYRIIQECVNNVIRHSGASHLDISLIRDQDGISVTIEDNGRGFDTGNPAAGRGLGLANIRTRVEYLRGKVEFDSTPGKGTLVAIHVPEKVDQI